MSERQTPAALRRVAQRLLPLLDLTSLNDGDDEAAIRKLCTQAQTPAGNVAAVCIWPRFIATAKHALENKAIPVAVVTNFPSGTADPEAAAAETAAAVAAGADEIDVVYPYRALLAGDRKLGVALVRACRQACGRTALLKVILETGQLGGLVRSAAEAAIEGGADFLKTSTGKTQPGASLDAAATMLAVIAEARRNRLWIGFKASGGIRTLSDAQPYLALYDRVLGEGAASAANFRIGASSLLKDVLLALGLPVEE
jgi:deoxyribose-phosphate aldolase